MTDPTPITPLPRRSGSGKRPTDVIFPGQEVEGIELGRLQRALLLDAEPLAGGHFRVTGGDEPHFVDPGPSATVACCCGDWTWRGPPAPGPCKHLLRVRLALGDPATLRAAGALVAALGAYVRTLEARLRPPPIRVTALLRARVAAETGLPEAALRFERIDPDEDATVTVLQADTGEVLGSIVRGDAGVPFVREAGVAAA